MKRRFRAVLLVALVAGASFALGYFSGKDTHYYIHQDFWSVPGPRPGVAPIEVRTIKTDDPDVVLKQVEYGLRMWGGVPYWVEEKNDVEILDR